MTMCRPPSWDFPSCSFSLSCLLFLSFLADNRSHRKHHCECSCGWLMVHCFFFFFFLCHSVISQRKQWEPKSVPILKESQFQYCFINLTHASVCPCCYSNMFVGHIWCKMWKSWKRKQIPSAYWCDGVSDSCPSVQWCCISVICKAFS